MQNFSACCFWVAAKADENYVDARDLCHQLKKLSTPAIPFHDVSIDVSHKPPGISSVSVASLLSRNRFSFSVQFRTVLSEEVTILQALSFSLLVHLPCAALEGFFFSHHFSVAQLEDPSKTSHRALYESCSKLLVHLCSTELPMLYTPSQLAAASILHRIHLAEQQQPLLSQSSSTDPKDITNSLQFLQRLEQIDAKLPDAIRAVERDVAQQLQGKQRGWWHTHFTHTDIVGSQSSKRSIRIHL